MALPDLQDEDILGLLKTDGDKAIEILFRKYYAYVCTIIYRVLPNSMTAEDIAQDVFFGIWKKRETIIIGTSFKAYLRRAAINRTLNHIRDSRMNFDKDEAPEEMKADIPPASQQLEANELEEEITRLIDALPERCRIIFMLNRFEGMAYKEIASELDISVKTVENQISKALKYLRENLGDRDG